MKKPLSYNLGLILTPFTVSYKEVRSMINTVTPNFIDLKVTGRENIPASGPGIIASNHESFLDILLLGAVPYKRLFHFVAKQELFESEKVYGSWLKKQIEKWYAMPINRDNPKVGQIKEFMKTLNEDNLLAIFPEGTRKKPVPLHTFHNLAAMLSYDKNIPVIPTGIIGTRYAEKHLFDTTHPKVEINFGKALYCRKISGQDKRETWNNFNVELKENISRLMKLDPFLVYDLPYSKIKHQFF